VVGGVDLSKEFSLTSNSVQLSCWLNLGFDNLKLMQNDRNNFKNTYVYSVSCSRFFSEFGNLPPSCNSDKIVLYADDGVIIIK
jgi:hypothetical protein